MIARLPVPIGMLCIALSSLALMAGDRGISLLLLALGGFLLARSCFTCGGAPPTSLRSADDARAPFPVASLGDCPPERLREARELAARVADSTRDARRKARDEQAVGPRSRAGESPRRRVGP
ncbi:hypothetical protein FJV46_07255 [Arthrobacter agilis]|uniref:hypothetical protein n=1 Tax=Arthrobacter agilis TaxID=37921 RepID=UPI000B363FB0|nr:hypothetical protein [Arthrobacter agilis]OUM42950.1 hypothetical protein B8W74_06780 [Arthrobacter agilis]PPB45896.1 hypothetical protein CI784_08975 [Arthrobacter agilis]TPV25438.1 hypothetical protein FJV46_07255 [Arthrobacter agilis]VDR33177.1 Uncharacterised protein [Arthrobacter agilis]